MLDRRNLAGIFSSALIERASPIALSEKSTPVTFAPSRAHDIVSSPKWHCRCSSDLPRTSPTSRSSIGLRRFSPALNSASRYPRDAAWIPAIWFHASRLTFSRSSIAGTPVLWTLLAAVPRDCVRRLERHHHHLVALERFRIRLAEFLAQVLDRHSLRALIVDLFLECGAPLQHHRLVRRLLGIDHQRDAR